MNLMMKFFKCASKEKRYLKKRKMILLEKYPVDICEVRYHLIGQLRELSGNYNALKE